MRYGNECATTIKNHGRTVSIVNDATGLIIKHYKSFKSNFSDMSQYFEIPLTGTNHSCEVEKKTCRDSTRTVADRDTVIQGTTNEMPIWSDALMDGEGPIKRITMKFISVHMRLISNDHGTLFVMIFIN